MPRTVVIVRPCFKTYGVLFFSLFLALQAWTQDSLQPVQLDSVVVKAFDRNSRLRDVPAAVNYINRAALQRFGTASVVDAVNATPGVRMEERSPGSYRFTIRGSSLRSPFGVRNVKVYYNDLPLTDPSGLTYLNSLGFYDYGSMEIIKGPGSSFYGAGTGGVLLINSIPSNNNETFFAEHTMGSYALQNSYAAVTAGNEVFQNRIAFQHQQSDGYRTQSALKRNIVNWSSNASFGNKNDLKTTFLYSDLFYETPGALTLAEWNSNPRAARPAAGVFPGAEAARAAIYQQTILAGASFTHRINERWHYKTVTYGAFTKLRNPAIRNWGRNSEPHVGGRAVITYNKVFQKAMLTATAGAEWQQGFATYSVHKNKSGNVDTLQTLDDVTTRQGFLFGNVQYSWQHWLVEAGASLNQYKIGFQRLFPAPLPRQGRTFNNEVAPRISVMHKLKTITIYSNISKGFSSPTTAEAVPTGSAVNLALNAEHGTNYEAGFRGLFFKTLSVDFNAFLFHLKNTIVQRRDSGGGDYYANAGGTDQHGIELALHQPLFATNTNLKAAVWASYTWHQFRYRNFKQLATDFSGNQLPNVAPHTMVVGLDFSRAPFTASFMYLYSAKTPLNDANTAFSKSYQLVNAKLGYVVKWQEKISSTFSVGINNALNQTYSLGNDINAAAGRYYNAAPRRNYFLSLSVQWLRKKRDA